jgi:cell division protein FtsN
MENNNKNVDFGTMSGIVIVVIILLVGAFYFAGQRMEKSKEFQANINLQKNMATSGPTDDLSNIEKDAQSLNFDNLGSGIDSL